MNLLGALLCQANNNFQRIIQQPQFSSSEIIWVPNKWIVCLQEKDPSLAPEQHSFTSPSASACKFDIDGEKTSTNFL